MISTRHYTVRCRKQSFGTIQTETSAFCSTREPDRSSAKFNDQRSLPIGAIMTSFYPCTSTMLRYYTGRGCAGHVNSPPISTHAEGGLETTTAGGRNNSPLPSREFICAFSAKHAQTVRGTGVTHHVGLSYISGDVVTPMATTWKV